MDLAANPYSPGSGLRPKVLSGREAEISAFDLMIARAKLHRPNRGMVLTGLRGVGKTVLLNVLRAHADNHGWLTVQLEGRPEARGRATPKEREYMSVMAVDGAGPSRTGELAARLGTKASSLGPTRAQLIQKGMIYAPDHGQVAFTVPGMADFIARQSRE